MLIAPTLLLALCPQERPLVKGAYRGPYDEVLVEQSAAAREGVRNAAMLDGWDRWEFWFEHERSQLFSGSSRLNQVLLLDSGNYGRREGSLARDEVVGQGLPILLKAMDSPFPGIREAAALSLGRIGEASSLGALKKGTSDPIAQVRQASLLGLGLLDNDRGLVFLAEHWSDDQLPISDRCFAAIGIGLSGRREGGDLLKLALERNLKTDRLYGEQEVLLQALVWSAGLQGSSDFTPLLMDSFQELESSAASASRRIRSLICWALGAIGDSSARPWLAKKMSSPDVQIQRAASQAIGSLGDPSAVPALAARLLQGGDIQTQMNCLFAIGRLGGSGSDSVFKKFDEDSKKHRQLRAAWALGIGMSQSDSLADQLTSEFISRKQLDLLEIDDIEKVKMRRDEERLRAALALALSFYGDSRSVVQLKTLLTIAGVSPDLLGYTCISLGRFGGEESLAALSNFYAEGSREIDARRGLALGLGLHNSQASAKLLSKILIEEKGHSVRRGAAEAFGFNRDATAFNQLCAALQKDSLKDDPDRYCHLLLALGYMGDPYSADRLSAPIQGLDYRQEFPLLRALSSY